MTSKKEDEMMLFQNGWSAELKYYLHAKEIGA